MYDNVYNISVRKAVCALMATEAYRHSHGDFGERRQNNVSDVIDSTNDIIQFLELFI